MAQETRFPDYPFTAHYLDLPAGRMHYVDEGTGPVVLFLHGNPTWSFYFRRCIAGLADAYRCIAPDFLGFGLSDHPPAATFGYTPEDHAATVDALLERLGLERYVLVGQEWGGAIGIDCATREPERLRAVVAMNSWFWPVGMDRRFRRSSYSGAGFGRGVLATAMNITVQTMFTRHGRSQVPEEVSAAYRAVQDDPAGRDGIRIFKRELVRATRWLAAVRDRQRQISDRPTLLLWGGDDHLFGSHELHTWQALFRNTQTVRFEHAGHYLCEEIGHEVVPPLRAFLDGIDRD